MVRNDFNLSLPYLVGFMAFRLMVNRTNNIVVIQGVEYE